MGAYAARQLTTGRWVSKMGGSIDIEHASPDALEGWFYGRVTHYMKRQRTSDER
ncbi:MAG: hypothetical protein O3A46_06805 [Candidatus Poribacteria bacterium]|nr:hypothetical protein [Candidatus Poribacteria bacterium]